MCGNSRGISLLSVVGKVYGRILIKRIRAKAESVLREEQCGFSSGRSCVDQIFVVRQLWEKHVSKGRNVFWAFMDLEKCMTELKDRRCGRCCRCMEWVGNC